MTKSAAAKHVARSEPKPKGARAAHIKIHPVIIYPFRQPTVYGDLEALYELVARLDGDRTTYARPITVMDRKTHYAMDADKPFHDFRKSTVANERSAR